MFSKRVLFYFDTKFIRTLREFIIQRSDLGKVGHLTTTATNNNKKKNNDRHQHRQHHQIIIKQLLLTAQQQQKQIKLMTPNEMSN